MAPTEPETHAGQAIYTPRSLKIYDWYVLGLSNRFIWRCPSSHILDLYNRNATSRHLDAGVGTGYFLEHCRFPSQSPHITLLDLNASSLAYTAQRIARYRPTTIRADVLQPIALEPRSFDSIGLSYLVHCLPGDMSSKGRVFAHLSALLADGGVLFGATILAQGIPQTFWSRSLMGIYNRKGIFGNGDDSELDLRHALARAFAKTDIRIVGCVALFEAREPLRQETG